MLGGHVRDLPFEDPNLGLRAGDDRLRDLEVDELHEPVVGDEDVVRAHVAVDDLEGGPVVVAQIVGVREAAAGVGDDPGGDRGVDALALLALLRAQAIERLAVEVLHRDEVGAVPGADFVRLDDVRVVQASSEARFVEEHLAERRVLGEVGTEPLEDDQLVETARPVGDGEEDLRHSAAPERCQDLSIVRSRSRGLPLELVEPLAGAGPVAFEGELAGASSFGALALASRGEDIRFMIAVLFLGDGGSL